MQAPLTYSAVRCARLQLPTHGAAACRHTAARRTVAWRLRRSLRPQAAAGSDPSDPSASSSSGGPPPPPPPPIGSDAAAAAGGSMGSVDITSRTVSLPFGVPTAGAVFFMAGFLKVLVMCFPFSEMAVMMYVHGLADLGIWAAIKAIPLALALAGVAKLIVDRRLQSRRWGSLAIAASGVVLLVLSRFIFARPKPSPLDPMFARMRQDRAAAVADQRRMEAARAAQHRAQEQRLMQQPDAEVGRALQQQAAQAGGKPPRLTGQALGRVMAPSPPPPAAAYVDMEAGSQAEEPFPINNLPDGLLGHAMALAGKDHWHNFPRVSQRWRQVFAAEPGLRRPFQAATFRTSAQQALRLSEQEAELLPIAQHLVSFCWSENESERDFLGLLAPESLPTAASAAAAAASLARCLSALRGGRLAELQLEGVCSSVEGAAPELQQLRLVTSLELYDCKDQVVAVVLAAMGGRLQSLYLDFTSPAPALLDSLAQLPQLTALGLAARRCPSLAALTQLTRLKQLVLFDTESFDPLAALRGNAPAIWQPPPPSSLPASLERFAYDGDHYGFEVAGCQLGRFWLWQGPTHAIHVDEDIPFELPMPTLLPGLTSLALNCQGLQELPTGQYLTGLRHLELEENEFTRLPPAIGTATSLTGLCLNNNRKLSLGEPDAAQLGGLTRLVLDSPNDRLVGFTLGTLGSHLRCLQLELTALPSTLLDSIAQLSQLTSLGLGADSWPELGPLTRLSRLRQLALVDGGRMEQRAMQPEQAAGFIASLERFNLEMRCRRFQFGGCELQRCTVWRGSTVGLTSDDDWLHHLPLLTLSLKHAMGGVITELPNCLANYRGLTRLTLVGQGLTDLPAGEYLAELQLLDLACIKFTRLPAVIATAAALACLIIGSHLVAQDKLNCPGTAAQDIASLAMTSRALSTLAKGTLWGLLGDEYPEEGATTAKSLATVPKQDHWEACFIDSRTRKLKEYTAAKTLARQYEEEVPKEVPAHIFGEVARLRCLGLAASNAKNEFQLTDKELRRVERVDKSRGSMGTAHIHALTALVRTAQAKHGSLEGMAAVVREKAAKRERAAASKQEAAAARRQALAAAAGLEDISADVADVGYIASYLRTPNAKGGPTQQQLVPFVQLADWAVRHAGLAGLRQEIKTSEARFMMFKVMFRDEYDGGYFNNYFAKAHQAASQLNDDEEEDCIRLACQQWAQWHGGVRAALTQPEVPQEGPLRDALAAVLRQRPPTSIAFDLGWDMMDDDQLVDMGEGPPESQPGAYGAGSATFFGDFSHFIQVELGARSEEALDALQAQARTTLPLLAQVTGSPSGAVWAEACLVAFDAPEGEAEEAADDAAEGAAPQADQAAGGAPQQVQQAAQAAAAAGPAAAAEDGEPEGPAAHRCLFYVGVSAKENPASLLTGQVYQRYGSSQSQQGALSQVANKRDWFVKYCKRGWDGWEPGMAVRLRLLTADQVPSSVREAAAEA
ncbi:small GTP-binding [Chlorella sorokiniana]|uniref:Small GTP-binding n=1 Tax=Chlorella sorokiniana TaxID=3076 RepID=A0A2P6TK86_CHLSO|nr:small GTP-binding [Chlorella sorokiniana]|eukprot:PRW44489.1 small GTP-binding [Chlorella sorokiniana]